MRKPSRLKSHKSRRKVVRKKSALQIHPSVVPQLVRPTHGEILLVHSLSISNLRKFVETGIRRSRDRKRIEVASLYEAVGHPELKSRKFASVTAYIAKTFNARNTQNNYSEGSNIHLILNQEKIADRLFIFNGDVATLGNYLQNNEITADNVRVIPGNQEDPFSALDMLCKNNGNPRTEPRLRGVAFEARLLDGIRSDDVDRICIENMHDQEAHKLAAQLLNSRKR
jgi:hypothetical protein